MACKRFEQFGIAGVLRRRFDQDDDIARRHVGVLVAKTFTDQTLDAIAVDRPRRAPSRYGHPDSRLIHRIRYRQDRKVTISAAFSPGEYLFVLLGIG